MLIKSFLAALVISATLMITQGFPPGSDVAYAMKPQTELGFVENTKAEAKRQILADGSKGLVVTLTGPKSLDEPTEEQKAVFLTKDDDRQIKCLAKNIYFEARGEPEEGQEAVAHVTMNRARSGDYPEDVCAVVYQKNSRVCQFSWTCDGRSDNIRQITTFRDSLEIAKAVYTDQVEDNTKGSLFYHASYVSPKFFKRLTPTVTIGRHIFYDV